MLVIQERRDNPTDKQDLLNIMLNCEDKKTGKRLSDESIRYNVSPHRDVFTAFKLIAGCVAAYFPCRR